MNTINPLNLIWIDLEMTGLDPEQDRIIEIATVVTDAELNVLAEGPSMVIHQAETLLDGMDDWNTTHHGNSGLAERVRKSTINEEQASQATLEFLQQWVPKGQSPMCGNTVGQDRRFLTRYMPELAAFFHYRNIDVSTLKELARRWKPEVAQAVVKKGRHLALDDIYDSIAELSHYRTTFIQT